MDLRLRLIRSCAGLAVKNLLNKALNSQPDSYLAILENRNTPVDGYASPAQLLMSRSLRYTIPTLPHNLKTKVVDPKVFQENREKKQQQQKLYHDRRAHSLPTLQKGEHVRIRNGEMWKPPTVIKNAREPRSYVVQTPEGGRYCRNRSHLLKSKEWNSWQLEDSEEEEDQITEVQDETRNLMLKETTQQLENLSKQYITRSGRVSKPPQRLGY